MDSLQKNIIKTVLIIVAVMATILVLFIHKITTPRYLSDIELKINGLILLKSPQQLSNLDERLQGSWLLLVNNEKNKKIVEEVHNNLKGRVSHKLLLVDQKSFSALTADEETMPLINANGEYMAFLKPPYEKNKMIMTLSSTITHR